MIETLPKSLVKGLIEGQDTCPRCGVSWLAVEDCLYSERGSDDYHIGQLIIRNCSLCKMRFEKEMEV